MIDNYTDHSQDPLLQKIIVVSNLVGLILSWLSIITAMINFTFDMNVPKAILIASFAPFRYFFFDVKPSKLQKRPPSLNRIIPLSIYIKYLTKSFPIPNGYFLASCYGFFLAVGRAYINGYGLLWFDTFTFMYKIRNNVKGIPLDQNIKLLHDNKTLKKMEEDATDEKQLRYLQNIAKGWEKVQMKEQLSFWNFPLRRYVYTPTFFFTNQEVGNESKLDDKYELDIVAYNKAHPDHPIYLKKNEKKKQTVKI